MWLLYELQVRGLHQTLLDKYLSIKKTCASWCTNSQRRHLGQLQLKKNTQSRALMMIPLDETLTRLT
jgi:hypothetical protein